MKELKPLYNLRLGTPKLIRIIGHYVRRLLGKERSVAIIAAGPATRALVPWERVLNGEIECWSLNRFWREHRANGEDTWVLAANRWFEVHPPVVDSIEENGSEFADFSMTHAEWIAQDHEFPIYFLTDPERSPAGVRYPMEQVTKEVGESIDSSVAYMLALAIAGGIDRVELYGVEMPAGSAYFWQRPNMEKMIGLARGEGMEVYIPPQSALSGGMLYMYDEADRNYDDHLRRELATMGRHGRIVEGNVKAYSGAIQALDTIAEAIRIDEDDPDLRNNKRLFQILTQLSQRYRNEAQKYQAAANHFRGRQDQLSFELSYRDKQFDKDIYNIMGGGTSLQEAMDIYEREVKNEQTE